MRGLDTSFPHQISSSTRQFQDTVMGSRGTSMWMSIRSSMGPEMRFWYLVTKAGSHVHAFCVSLSQPHGL